MRRVKWHGTRKPRTAVRALADHAQFLMAPKPTGHWVLSLGDHGPFHRLLDEQLRVRGVPFRSHTLEEVKAFTEADCQGLVVILCGWPDTRSTTEAARMLAVHPVVAGVEVEYVMVMDPEHAMFERYDEYRDTFFVSPLLLDQPSPYALYEESLQHFEQKCGLRDYLDLYQCLKWVVQQNIPGDIAEFGSYKGHSGWLMARTLKALGSNKQLFMFDTFANFPAESLGLDRFWSHTHEVTFDDVRARFEGFDHVQFIRGDFTQTLDSSGLGSLALAYVDCDSYRATRYLLEALIPERLNPRGMLICEDYGHPALLGHRAAVHESMEGRQGFFQFYSQFSGLYVVLKL